MKKTLMMLAAVLMLPGAAYAAKRLKSFSANNLNCHSEIFYDNDGRVAKVVSTPLYGSYDDMEVSANWVVDWSGLASRRVTVTGTGGNYEYNEINLSPQGTVSSTSYVWNDQSPSVTEFAYDSDGYVTSLRCSDEMVGYSFSWENGNLVRIDWGSGAMTGSYGPTEYAAGAEFVGALMDAYGMGTDYPFLFTLLGLGKASRHILAENRNTGHTYFGTGTTRPSLSSSGRTMPVSPV